jgi:hypothetical protein
VRRVILPSRALQRSSADRILAPAGGNVIC